jgi:hypothetical protein
MRTKTTNAGTWWDLEACIAYGEHPGDDLLMDKLLEANLDFLTLKQLSADIVLNVPDVAAKRRVPLVPWTEVTIE